MMTDDVSGEYLTKSAGISTGNDAREMEEWLKNFKDADQSKTPVMVDTVPQPYPMREHELPAPPPARDVTPDTLGRQDSPEDSIAGTIMRNIAEALPGAARGVHDALYTATTFVDPLANWLDENVADLGRYELEGPKTTTGQIAKSAAQFLTGFVPAVKGLKALGMTGTVTAPTAAGGIADFMVMDPHAGRLSDLWNQAGLPKNLLTDFLASKPDDTEIEGRFKNALEGLGVGAAVEGIMLGAKAIRASRKVKEAVNIEEKQLKAKYGEITDEQFAMLGDPTKPVIETRMTKPPKGPGKVIKGLKETEKIEPRAVIRSKKSLAEGVEPEDFETYINFARIDTPDQVKFVIGKMAEGFKGTIDEARRNTITWKETEKMAEDLGMTPAELLERRKGQPFNAEEALAARQLWATSAERLLEAAKKASSPNAGAIDQFNFRKMMAIHYAIQAEVIGARTETARALASWKIPAGGNIEKARAIQQMMGAMGGPDASAEMARRLAILAESGASSAAIAKFASKGYGATTVDAIKEVWINALLSSPKTHVVNTMSNSIVVAQQIYERFAAEGISRVTGSGAVAPGEAAAMAFGLIGSYKDAFIASAKTLRTGETDWLMRKIDLQHPNAISSEAFRMSKETGPGRFVDFLGSTINVPGRLLAAEDEFFYTIGYRMELRAQALRQAYGEGYRNNELIGRVNQLIDNPPEHLRINAADAATYNTFTNDIGWFGRAVMNLRNSGGAMNPIIFVAPFIRTPVNIARYAFERTPFAPLVGQWRADIAAGGARADLALARMATGTAIMTTAMDMADVGTVSGPGPKDPAQREALIRQGWQPYSIKVGDRWYSYNRADPFGMTMGFAASITEAVKNGEINEDDVDEWNEVTAMAIAAVAQVSISKTYLEGFSNAVEAMNDPTRYSESYVNRLVGSFAPAMSAAIKNFVDPVQREAGTPSEAVMSRIVVLSEQLPPRRNLWGEEVSYESGLGRAYDFISPIASKSQVDSPIDREIVRLGEGPLRITKKTSFDGVPANLKFWPGVYDEYTRLAGNGLKHPAWGMGAKDYLDAVVSGNHPISSAYSVMSDESRRAFIKNTISDYRKLAQQQILQDPRFKDFATEIQHLKMLHQGSRMPVFGGE